MADSGILAGNFHNRPAETPNFCNDGAAHFFLTQEGLARLSSDGSHFLIVSMPSGKLEHLKGSASSRKITSSVRRGLRQSTFNAIAAGICIGASAGLSVAGTLVLMTQKPAGGVIAFIESALTLFT